MLLLGQKDRKIDLLEPQVGASPEVARQWFLARTVHYGDLGSFPTS